MTVFNGLKLGAAAVLASTMLLAGATANAAISATFLQRSGGSFTGTVPNGAANAQGGGGLFEFQQTSALSPDLLGPGANFVAFCIEFNEFLDNNDTYNLVDLKDAPIDALGALPTGMGLAKANLIATIIGNVFGTSGPPAFSTLAADVDKFNAVQLAIWEIVHENSGLGFDVDANNAKWTVFPAGADTLAQTYIDNAVGLLNSWVAHTANGLGLSGLVSTSSADNSQDFLVWDGDPRQEVPLPAAAWLLLSGLAGLGVVARRRKTA